GLLLVVFVAGGVLAVRRPLRELEEPERGAAVALAALPAAFALHGLVDYDADFVAVTAPTLFALGVLVAAGRPLARKRPGLPPASAALAVAAPAVLALALPWLSARKVDASYAATSAGRLQAAVDDAGSARSLDPLSTDPLYALATA